MAGLTWEAALTLLVVALMVAAMARDWVAPAVAVLGADIVLLVAGVIDAPAAFSGFSNPAPITVAALFVVARAVEKTGALRPLITGALGARGGGGRWRLLRLLGPTAASSAFLNNTPIVAMLAPTVADWAEKRGESASRYLMPLSFATILGGTLTVIGTSTNLVVSGLLETHGQAPIGMFEISAVGLPVAVLGIAIIVALAPRVLPDRRAARRQFAENAREYVVHQVVAPGGPLDGKTVEEAGLRHLQGVFLAEVEREGRVIAPPGPTTVLQGRDRLTFAGRVDLVRDLQAMRGLVSEESKHTDGLDGIEHTFFEAVVGGSSSLVGTTLKEASFRARFQAAVMAIHRSGERVRAKLGEVKLKEGDTLLLLSDPGFADRLAALGTKVDDGVAAVWSLALRAGDIEATLADLGPRRVADEYKDAKRAGADPALVEVLHQRFTSVQRLLNTVDDTDERLRLLDARLGATVARAAEVALTASTDGADAVGAELDGVVGDLTALRAALDDLG